MTATSVVGGGGEAVGIDEEDEGVPPPCTRDSPLEPAFEAPSTTWAPAFRPSWPLGSLNFCGGEAVGIDDDGGVLLPC